MEKEGEVKFCRVSVVAVGAEWGWRHIFLNITEI